MNYIVYQAYGKDEIGSEAIFSALTLMYLGPLSENTKIIFYTDRPQFFYPIFKDSNAVIFEEINAEKIKDWRGKIDFVHRVKIMILKDAVAKYKGNILYVDSDTWYSSTLDAIFSGIAAGKIYMHTNEGALKSKKNPIFKKMYRFIKSNSFTINQQTLQISDDQDMWNAGVIGFNSSYNSKLDEVLELTDKMYSKYQKHVMEQLAFSIILNKAQPLEKTDNEINHYWYDKSFRFIIADFLEKNKNKGLTELIALTPSLIPLIANEPEEKSNKGWFAKLFKQ